jgi:hypothetical protein
VISKVSINFKPSFSFIFGWIMLLCIAFSTQSMGQGQGTQVQFGQNRVQYHDFEWQYYDTDNFTTYYYPGGQNIAKFVIMAAEEQVLKLEEQLNYKLSNQIELLIYNDITDLAQTNVGLGNETYNLGGNNKIIGNKLFLYFDGNHNHLYKDLNEGLARIFIASMMSGSTIQEILQNTIFGNLPPWFSEGLIQYTAEPWNTDLDEELRDHFEKNPNLKFKKFSQTNPSLAGHSMWYFIEKKYGKEALKDVIYLTRINKASFSGFGFVLGTSQENLELEWATFYLERKKLDIDNKNPLPAEGEIKIKTRKKRTITPIILSPDATNIAYATHDGGAFKLFVKKIETGKKKKILRGGFKSDNYPHDNSYPQIAFSQNGGTLGVCYEKRDKIKFLQYDLETKKVTKHRLDNFQRINDFSFTGNSNDILFSAQLNGKTDIYLFSLNSGRNIPITNDFWDDLQPTYVNTNGVEGVLFVSNRNTDTLLQLPLDTALPIGTFDLFFYNLKKRGNSLSRLTKTPFGNEKLPIVFGNGKIGYLSDENGIFNQYELSLATEMIRMDSVWTTQNGDIVDADGFDFDSTKLIKIGQPIYKEIGIKGNCTDFKKSIQQQAAATRNSASLVVFNEKGKQKVFLSKTPFSNQTQEPIETSFRVEKGFEKLSANQSTSAPNSTQQQNNTELIDLKQSMDSLFNEKTKYQFDTQYGYSININNADSSNRIIGFEGIGLNTTSVPSIQGQKFNPVLAVPYKARFTSNYLVTSLDNSLAFQNYTNFNISGPVFNYPDLNGMITFGITDIMEDHRIVGGLRIPSSFAGSEEFVSYSNLKHRLDYRFLFYRKSDQVQFADPANPFGVLNAKLKSNYAEIGASYPIDITKAIKGSIGFRNDKGIVSLTDQQTENRTNDIVENWGSARLEFVHDKSKEVQMNIRDGFRYKMFFEYFRNFSEKRANLYNIGYDVRHYFILHKNILWANRISGASSFGQRKIAYYLGGVDSWINPKFDNTIPVDQNNNYAFQAIATNMRGFPINTRNGNSFMVINSELRVPLFSYLAKKPLKSPFLNNFQIVGFFDIGSAYKGLTPFAEENPFSTEIISPGANNGTNPVVVTVNYFRNPTVFGFGGGFRTTLLGYFFRVDAGWGKDGQSAVNPKPLWYLSLSKDF